MARRSDILPDRKSGAVLRLRTVAEFREMTLTRSLLNCFVILLAPVPALTPICHAEDIPDYEANIVPFLHGSTGIGFGEFFCGRNVENGTPIDASGQLMSCEAFNDVRELHRGVREH